MINANERFRDFKYPYVDVLDASETRILNDENSLDRNGKSIAHVLLEGEDEKIKGASVEMFIVYGDLFSSEISLGVKKVISNQMELSWLLPENILFNLKGQKVSLYYKYDLLNVVQIIGHELAHLVENAFFINVNALTLYDLYVTGALDHYQLAKSAYIYQLTSIDNNAGRWHSVTRGVNSHLGINDKGILYGWGYNGAGNLGLPESSAVEKPTLCMFKEKTKNSNGNIIMATTAYDYSLVLDKDGYLYGAGNHTKGCLGDNKGEISTPYFVKIGNRKYKYVAVSTLYDQSYRGYVSFAIDSKNELYRCGWSQYNTHLSTEENFHAITTMSKIENEVLASQKWKSIVHNIYMAAAINDKHQVYLWGAAWQGCLGDGRADLSIHEPHHLDFNGEAPDIKKIVLGGNHALAMDFEGNLWGWGNNDHFSLAQSTDNEIIPPTKISLPKNAKCLDIATDLYTSAVITTDGKIYAWGHSLYGNIGLGREDRIIKVPTHVPFKERAQSLEMGYWSLLVLATK